mgnify:CR=1 FL=1
MFKFSGFTPRANSSINAAMAEASLLGHSFVGTEHLLWGLLREEQSPDCEDRSASDKDQFFPEE